MLMEPLCNRRYLPLSRWSPIRGVSEGEVSGTTVTCPWHRAQYDLKTGGVLTPPAPEGVASYKVVVEGDDVSIEL